MPENTDKVRSLVQNKIRKENRNVSYSRNRFDAKNLYLGHTCWLGAIAIGGASEIAWSGSSSELNT